MACSNRPGRVGIERQQRRAQLYISKQVIRTDPIVAFPANFFGVAANSCYAGSATMLERIEDSESTIALRCLVTRSIFHSRNLRQVR